MNRKRVFFLLGALCIAASIIMYMVGKNSSHLSELSDFWWIPMPLAALALLIANKKNNGLARASPGLFINLLQVSLQP